MPLGEGYPALANEKERKQIGSLDDRLREIDMRLALLNSGISGNFKSLSTIFSSKEKPLSTDGARSDRYALAERAKAERVELERQKAAIQRQRVGMEGGIKQRRLGAAAVAAAKLPPADRQLLDQLKNHPEQRAQFMQEAQEAIVRGIEGGAGADEVIRAGIHLRSVAALIDNINGEGTLSGAESGEVTPGPTEQAASAFNNQYIPRMLRDSGIIPPPSPVLKQNQAQLISEGSDPEKIAQLQDSIRRGAPSPESIDDQPGTTLEDKLNFASQGPAPSPGEGRQFVFTGSGSSFQGGTAPVGSANPFAEMQRDPALEQRIGARNISGRPSFTPGAPPATPAPAGNPMPATPNQAAPLAPPGPVTNPAVPPTQLPPIPSATPTPPPQQASSLGAARPPTSTPTPGPTPEEHWRITQARNAAQQTGQFFGEVGDRIGQAFAGPQDPAQLMEARKAEAAAMAQNLAANGVPPAEQQRILYASFPDLIGQ